MVNEIKKNRSRGGAMFHVLYLALTRKYWWAMLVMIGMFIPLVSFIVAVAMFIVGGIYGKRWIDGDATLTDTQKNTYTTLFDRIGYFIFLVVVLFIVIFLVMLLLGKGFYLFNMMNGGQGLPMGDFDVNSLGLEGLEGTLE